VSGSFIKKFVFNTALSFKKAELERYSCQSLRVKSTMQLTHQFFISCITANKCIHLWHFIFSGMSIERTVFGITLCSEKYRYLDSKFRLQRF
jgi:hypothetical protein